MPALMHQFLFFLSRMSTAVAVLAVLAGFSVIGTLIPQGRPPHFYEAQYGPDMADVMLFFSLDHMYHVGWFLALTGFLVLSVSVCLMRNGPRLWRTLKAPKTPPTEAALRQWQIAKTKKTDGAAIVALLCKQGFQVKRQYAGGETMMIRGTGGRLGYFFTHLAVIFLCAAALLTGVGGYRLTLHLTEGQSHNIAALWQNGQFNVFDLPFTLTNKKIEVEHYFTGKPSQFKTTLEVAFEGQKTTHTVEVNKPLKIAGHMIYQADYGDGGSLVGVKLRDMTTGKIGQTTHQGRTGHNENMLTNTAGYELIAEKYNPHTILTKELENGALTTENLGPSVEVLLTTPTQSPLRLQVFKERPWLMGVGTAVDAPYSIQFIGLDTTKDEGWPLVAELLESLVKPWPKDAAILQGLHMSNMKPLARTALRSLPEEERLRQGLGAVMAATFTTQLGLPVLPVFVEGTFTPYSGLIISHDPGMWLFIFGGVFIVLGISLMLYFPFCKVWVLPNSKKEGTFVAAQATKQQALPKKI